MGFIRMKSSHPLWQLLLSRLRQFYREPHALFWVYGFPLIMALSLGIALRNRKPEPLRIAVEAGPYAEDARTYLAGKDIIAEIKSEAVCREYRRIGKVPLFVRFRSDGSWQFVYDETQTDAVSARYQVDDALARRQLNVSSGLDKPDDELVTERGSRYIDWFMPGLIGMNIMGGGLWGIGFVIVDMRVRKLMKRLLATPMKRPHFLLAMLLARMLMLIPEIGALLLFATLVFGVPLRGDLMTLIVVIVTGAAAFSGIGLLVSSRTEKTETVSGLMNLVMLPMWLLSGVFFSSKRFPDATQPFIQALPLTQLNDALREVMLEGKSLPEIAWHLGILAVFAVVTFTLALKWFRWQ
jgi:ABC-type polysaccharide/polyol phosphate export permease